MVKFISIKYDGFSLKNNNKKKNLPLYFYHNVFYLAGGVHINSDIKIEATKKKKNSVDERYPSPDIFYFILFFTTNEFNVIRNNNNVYKWEKK